MSLVRFKNQTEYAFIVWMNSYPESFHWYDMQRFYTFVRTVARYRSKKWRDHDYFKQRILEHTPHFSEKNIEKFWNKMQVCLEFHTAPYIDSTAHSEDGKHDYKQVGIKDGKIYEIKITQAEFLGAGVKVNGRK